MTEVIAFDPPSFMERLIKVGFTKEQAEALVKMYTALNDAKLAAKSEHEKFKAKHEADMEKFRAKHEAEMEKFRAEHEVKMEKIRRRTRG